MSTRSRTYIVKLALMTLLLITFAFVLLINSLYTTDRSWQELELQDHGQWQLQSQSSALYRSKKQTKHGETIETETPYPDQTLGEPANEELVMQLENELPEIDYGFWYRYAKPIDYRINPDCARYPDPLNLQLHNTYWQTFHNANVTFRLYAAYLDMRTGIKSRGVVRILATANQIGDKFPITHCQLWYADHSRPIIVKVSNYVSIWIKSWSYKPLLNYPHLLNCPVPEALPPNIFFKTPSTVSLVCSSCEHATNSLRINYNLPTNRKKDSKGNSESNNYNVTTSPARPQLNFAVCVKGLDFPYIDLSERLIEWFELQRLLGASRIYAYKYDVHPAMQRVLDYYQRIDFLELRPLTLASGMPRLRHYQHMLLQQRILSKRLNELIPYNDCFYRNMYRHDYVLNVDIDEMIMPQGALRTWQQILDVDQKLTEKRCPNGFASICFINTHFSRVVPEAVNHEQLAADKLYVLQHTMRLKKYSSPDHATKCFHNTRYSEVLHNHLTLKWLPGSCFRRTIDTQIAQLQHYREADQKYNLTDLVEDRNAWKYATELTAAVEHVWLHLDDLQVQTEDPEILDMQDED